MLDSGLRHLIISGKPLFYGLPAIFALEKGTKRWIVLNYLDFSDLLIILFLQLLRYVQIDLPCHLAVLMS